MWLPVRLHPAAVNVAARSANASPTFRHQVFELPVLPLDITEYQVFHGHCQHCDAVSKGSYLKRHLVVRWGHV